MDAKSQDRVDKGGLRTPEVRLACIFAVCVASLRLLLARPLHFCGTPDACYYLGLGQSLANGGGFHTRFLYDFQQAHLSLPNTGIEYWRPGISLLLQLLRPLGAVTLHGAIVLTVVTGVLYAAAAWHVARQNGFARRFALGTFALCLVATPLWIGSLTPDSGLYYGAAVAWFLALFTVRRQGLGQDLAALLCVAAAYLIRNDAALLLVPLLTVLWRRQAAARASRNEPSRNEPFRNGSSPLYAGLMLCGFVLALVPMHLLYRTVLGTAFPSGTAQAFFLNDLGDFVRYGEPVSLRTLLAHGVKHLLVFRVATLATALYRIGALVIGYAGLIFLPIPFLREPGKGTRRDTHGMLPELIGPATLFAAMLAVYALLLPAIGGFSLLRSVLGVFPVLVVLMLLGVHRAARSPRIATFLVLALVASYTVSGVMDTRRTLEAANRLGATDRAVARTLASALAAAPGAAVVLTPDPVQFSVTTGYAAVALPSNGLDAIVRAAHDFRATHVILDTEDLPGTPEELQRRLRPLGAQTLPAEHTLIFSLPPDRSPLPAN